MKKILALLTLIILTTVSAYSQEESTVKVGQNITVEIDNETVIALTALANKTGTTAEYLWKVLVKQAPLEAVKEGIGLLIMLVVGGALCLVHKMLLKKEVYDEDTSYGVVMMFAAFIWGLVTIVFICSTVATCTDALNPEYWALKQILEQLK
jgi:uncharacterized membrane protein